jgi:hypothetical protein
VLAVVAVATVVWLAGRDGGASADETAPIDASVDETAPVDASAAVSAEPISTVQTGETVQIVPTGQIGAIDPPTTEAGGGVSALARLEEVWLLDRGDRTYDWGATIVSNAAEDRGPVTIVASLLDADSVEVSRVDGSIRSLAAGARATVGGVVDDSAGLPKRITVDVVVGDPLTEPAPRPDDLRTIAVERQGEGGSDGRPDLVVGRLRSGLDTELTDIRLTLVWRDENRRIVDSIFHDVERVRPGVDARFEVPVDERLAADGPPTEITWTH